MNKLRQMVFKWFLEDLPPFKWINGNKTEIAKLLAFISGLAVVAQQYFPGLLPIDQIDAVTAFIASFMGIQIGELHKKDKGE